MRHPARRLVALLAVAALSGCGSPQTHFFTLVADPATASGAALPDATAAGAPIDVQSVLLDPVLDRQSMVTEGTDGALTISNQDRWGAPLDEQVRRVLAADLAGRLAVPVLQPGDPVPPRARGLVVNVRRFAGNPAGLVTLQADWSLLAGGGRVVRRRSETITVQAADTAAPQVTVAMSRAVALLAGRIAAALSGP